MITLEAIFNISVGVFFGFVAIELFYYLKAKKEKNEKLPFCRGFKK